MNPILHILYYKILIFVKSNSAMNFSSMTKSIGSTIVYAVFAYGCFIISQNTIQYLLVNVKIGNFLLHRFMLVVLFIFFVAINVGNIVVSFSTLYKSKEVFHLVTKPISFTYIFLIKYLDNFFYSSATLLLIVFSVLIGYGNYFDFSLWNYPLIGIFIIFPFMFTAGSAGVIILLSIMILAGKWGVKKVLLFIALFYLSGIMIFYFVSNPLNLVERVFEYYPNIDQYFGFLENSLIMFLPNYWVAESLYWISENRFERAVPFIYANLVTSIFVFTTALIMARKWFYITWLTSLKINSELKSKQRFRSTLFRFENKSSLKSLDEAIIKREFWLFFREPSQWVHFVVMLILIFIFITSISGIDIVILETYNQYLKTLIYLIVTIFNSFLVASLSLRFVFPLISLEGEAIWKVRSAPIDHTMIMTKRLSIYFFIIFLIGQVISFFSNFQFPSQLSVIAQVNSAIISFTLVSLNFGMGGLFRNYKEKSAIRLASSQGASITFLFTLVYLLSLVIILFIPVSGFFQSLERGIPFSNMSLFGSTIILFIVGIIISFVSLRFGFKTFNSDI